MTTPSFAEKWRLQYNHGRKGSQLESTTSQQNWSKQVERMSREWPTLWTQSLVITLPKQGNLQQCQNYRTISLISHPTPQWGAADAEIKVPSGENTELKHSPFKAWSRSVYSHTCYAYCQGFLSCLFLHFRSIHPHFFQHLSRFLLCWLWLAHGFCVGSQNKMGHPAGCRFPC